MLKILHVSCNGTLKGVEVFGFLNLNLNWFLENQECHVGENRLFDRIRQTPFPPSPTPQMPSSPQMPSDPSTLIQGCPPERPRTALA